MESTPNISEMVNIAANKNIRDIGYISSRQAGNKERKSSLSINKRLPQSDTNPSPLKTIRTKAADESMVKSSAKRQLMNAVHDFKKAKLDITYFVAIFVQ